MRHTLETIAPAKRSVTQLKPGDRIVVIGAGPAGLTAAYLLSKEGYAVTVLEADNIVGGISRTVRYKGYRFDIGGHRFFTKIKPVQELWEELLDANEFITVPRLSRIHYNDKYFDYPLKPWNALNGLGLVNAVRIVWSYLVAHYFPTPVEENFEQWVTNRFGRRLYELFFKTYTEKVWGIPCTEIRAEWAAQRIQGLSLSRAILSATPLNRRPDKIKSLIEEFLYPRLGPGQMWEACADKVRVLGNTVLMEHYAVAIDTCEDNNGVSRVTGVRATSAAGETLHPADHVISTMPMRSLIRAISPTPATPVKDAAEGLRYRDFLVVALIVEGENLFPDNWIYVHTPGVKVGRVQNFNNWSAAMVPEANRTCLGLEYFCFKGDGLWESSDEALVALATRELEELGLAKRSTVRDGTVIRMPKAYPIYDPSYRGHLQTVRAFIDPIPNLHTVGRNGMHMYNNQDHSMLTAMMAVWNMQGASHDLWDVNTDLEYHEEQRLESDASQRTNTFASSSEARPSLKRSPDRLYQRLIRRISP